VQLEMNLAKDAKNNKKRFFSYVNQNRKVNESIPLHTLMNQTGHLVSTDEEKAEVLNNIFASVFTGNLLPHPSPVEGPQDGNQGGKVPPAVRDQV